MSKSIKLVLSCPADYAEVLAADAEPALGGAALCELILLSRQWHVGATDVGEGLVAVGVVLLLDDAHAADLLSGAAPEFTLYQAANAGRIVFLSAHLNPKEHPPVALQGVSVAAVERAMDSLHHFRLDHAETTVPREVRWQLALN